MSDVEYGINVQNKFALLQDDEHEPEQTVEEKAKQVIIEAKQKKKEQRIAEKASATKDEPKKIVAPKVDNKENHLSDDIDNRRSGRGGGRGISRGARGRGSHPRGDRATRNFDGEQQGNDLERANRGGNYRGRGRGRGSFRTDGDRDHQEGEFRGGRGGFRGGRGGRGGFRGGRGSGGNFRDLNNQQGENDVSHWAPNTDGQDSQIVTFDSRPQDNLLPRINGEFRGRGRGRGGRGRGMFDRHSGSDRTGVKPVDKRGGAGKGNWGTTNDELIGETENFNTSENKENVTLAAHTNEQNIESVTPPVESDKADEQPFEERGLTLAEYKAQQQKMDSNFSVRRVHMPKDMKIIPNKLDESYEQEEIIIQQRPSKKTFVDLPLQMQIEDAGGAPPRRGRGGGSGGDRGAFRSDRGGSRGLSGNRGSSRGGGYNQNGLTSGTRGGGRGTYGGRGYGRGDPFNVENEKEFPSL